MRLRNYETQFNGQSQGKPFSKANIIDALTFVDESWWLCIWLIRKSNKQQAHQIIYYQVFLFWTRVWMYD